MFSLRFLEIEEFNRELRERWKEIQSIYQDRLNKWKAMRSSSELHG